MRAGLPPASSGETTTSQAILHERALALARPARVEQADEVIPLLVFTIAGARHAVEAHFVREVLRGPEVSPVPSASTVLVGVTNVRGEILAVADISTLLGLATPRVGGPIVVLDGPAPPVGILVDGLDDFVEVPAGSIAPLPGTAQAGAPPAGGLVLGAYPDASVLSAAAVLSHPRLSTTEPRSGR